MSGFKIQDLTPWALNVSLAGTAASEAGEYFEAKLSQTANTNAWGSSGAEFKTGLRQLRTVRQFRAFGAGMAVVGAGAAGFQAGANAYCAVDCSQ